MKQLVGFVLASLLLLSCGGRPSHFLGSGDSLSFKYATLPTVVEYDGYTVVTLNNPWKAGKELHTYVLVPRDVEVPFHLPKGTVIRTPLERVVVFTTGHSSPMMASGC